MTALNYWTDEAEAAMTAVGVTFTREQLGEIAESLRVAQENWHLMAPTPSADDVFLPKVRELERRLDEEQRKIGCPECNGMGWRCSQGPYHYAEGTCWKCQGAGRVSPDRA